MKSLEKLINSTNLEKVVSESYSKSEVLRSFNLSINGYTMKMLIKILNEKKICYTHFDEGKIKTRIYQRIVKKCPICEKEFEVKQGSKKEKTTCSKSCSNTYFRSQVNHGNYKNGQSTYRINCFKYHKKKCVCCDEVKVVDVHHYDGNRNNNSPDNLIPLCPTHHKYWHSKYKKEVFVKINDYRNNFIEQNINQLNNG